MTWDARYSMTVVDKSEDTDDTGASVEAAVKQEEEIVIKEATAVNGGDGDGVNTFAAAIVVEDKAVNAKCVGVEAVKGDIMVKGSKANATAKGQVLKEDERVEGYETREVLGVKMLRRSERHKKISQGLDVKALNFKTRKQRFKVLSLLSPYSHPPLTLLSPSSHPPLTLLSPSSHPPLTFTLLSPSSHPPLTLLSPSSHPPLTLLSPSSHPPLTLLSPSSHPVLSCCGHVRIVKGRIYFRFGGFEFDWFKMRRFLFSILMIKEAIARYSLHSLTAEFFINTCDAHISKASSVANRRAGLPVFSTHGSIGSIDILYPDPVDLSETYFRRSEADQVPWEQKQSRAVFRGTMTNFHLFYDRQWRPSPRMRLHRMSDVRPDLIDARLVKGVDPVFLDELREDGIKMGGRLGPAELQAFKYEIEVDGGTGTCRTCGILASNQMIIKHASEYFEYFYPLLCPYQHFVPTHRYFDDLFERIEWARDHDLKAQQIVKQANRLARDVCTWEGRRLYWAILLAKYSASALEDPANVTRPAVFKCTVPPIQGRLEESKWKWLSADILSGIQGFKPQIPGNKFRDV
ncbi:unnamed protein product [Closterium sp. Naga37s-1]|nr:unnamed protein product [Closterium sp. Naga37s-1]